MCKVFLHITPGSIFQLFDYPNITFLAQAMLFSGQTKTENDKRKTNTYSFFIIRLPFHKCADDSQGMYAICRGKFGKNENPADRD